MSLTNNQEQMLEGLREDFEFMLKQEKWDACASIIQMVGDLGQENEALSMHQRLNRAKDEQDVTYEPYEHPIPPTIRPEEDDVPVSNPDVLGNWEQEGDEKHYETI